MLGFAVNGDEVEALFELFRTVLHPSIQMSLITAHFEVINKPASSLAASVVQVNLPSSPSIWSDYLVGDQEQECTNESDHSILPTKGENLNYSGVGVDHTKNSLDVAATSVSFVESILNRDREMVLDFPELLDGYSEY
ncbi:homeodomain-like protein [Artemisia annua]|uniref:Homeodomain-like protein n=1 Tax=Artemisia annua TaxID=35608 RepID=A0A2U1KFY2_ARTAN|nr:homeodomain-like protein [Artemisia annua]